MPVRERRLLLLPPAIALLLTVVSAWTGVGADALIAVPGLLLVILLIAGRYVGAERLVRLARGLPCRRHGREPAVAPRGARGRLMPRGGRLVAASLARRGPPERLLAR